MNQYERGYRDFSEDTDGSIAKAVADHFKGIPLDRSDEWFTGYQDARDDFNNAQCDA